MKIFVSWSGNLSHSIALLLRDWLPNVLQYVEQPFVSSKDIDKGTAWFSDISDRLNQSDFGIICLTRENLLSPWIHFEAGAIANKFSGARIPAAVTREVRRGKEHERAIIWQRDFYDHIHPVRYWFMNAKTSQHRNEYLTGQSVTTWIISSLSNTSR